MEDVQVWYGAIPASCDCCKSNILNKFYDVKMTCGKWSLQCPDCSNSSGFCYTQQPNGQWTLTTQIR